MLFLLAFTGLPAVAAVAQEPPAPGARIHRSIPPEGARTHVVVPGDRFSASRFRRWFYGAAYRDLWTTPISVAVLDLDRVGGGLTPLRSGGFGQSISLHFTGADGRRYTVRSLDKDPTKRISDELRDTVVENVLQDLISALLPAGALVVDALMQATGILHAPHTLVVIPDHPRLGEYREEFAGLIGTLQEHPSEGPDDSPGFAGSRKVSGTENLWEDLEDDPGDRVNARAFLKARLMDFLIGDKDRHSGQWRWARFPAGDGHQWLPVPEDRDQAFIHYDGFAMALARQGLPKQILFEGEFPNLIGLTINGWELDREFLVELDRTDWDATVAEFQGELGDAVIEDAVRRLPPEYYEQVGVRLVLALKARREALPRFAARYYELITRQAEIWATDEDELAICEHLENGDLRVRIRTAADSGETPEPPYFERTFRAAETRELRIYLRGGEDRAEVSGGRGQIRLHIDGGGGDDAFVNTSLAPASDVRFYDFRGDNRFATGTGARIDERPYRRPPGSAMTNARYALDWGAEPGVIPLLAANPENGLFLGALVRRTRFGFRKDPFAVRHSFGAGLASTGFRPFVSYTGQFRDLWRGLDARVHTEYSGIEGTRFSGFGNDTETPRSSSYYRLQQSRFLLAPSVELRRGAHLHEVSADGMEPLRSEMTAAFGPILKHTNTSEEANRDRFLGALETPLYGAGAFGQLGAQARFRYDTRDNPAYPTRGFVLRTVGEFYPPVWDVASAFGSLAGEVRAYLTAPAPARPTLALRAGAKNVWGTFPFHEAAFLGGPGFAGVGDTRGALRGYRRDRFAGDASLYGNAELRVALGRMALVLPAELGVFLAGDAGRVFFAGEPASGWHAGAGGGLWVSFLERRQTLSVAVMRGPELTGVYLRAGFLF
ncbi:MAG: BamA/TamA family outer membrane protein [Acidobacteria bacterium]|nr:BamA/TamA family outer membrane protein [Acidobacteriota bacterium]